MAKTLIVGDVHLKTAAILGCVDASLAEHPDIARIVFTGDICDEWNATDEAMMVALEGFTSWVEDQRANGMQVDIVFGNHDFQYLLGRPGPGTHMDLLYFVRGTLFPLGLRAATTVGDFLVTHAGLTQTFAKKHMNEPTNAAETANQLNAMLDEGTLYAWNNLFSCGVGRGGWGTPGPLWADKWELEEDPVDDIPQIVGHTPVPTVCQGEGSDSHGRAPLWFVDTFSLRQNLTPIGDGSLMLVEGNDVHIC